MTKDCLKLLINLSEKRKRKEAIQLIIIFQIFPTVNSPPPVSTVTVPGDDTSTTEEVPDVDLTPDITPCNTDKDYSIKVFKHPTLDAVAIEDTNENLVEIYEWIQEINESDEMVLRRDYKEMTSDQFTELHRRDYTFIGYTIPSE